MQRDTEPDERITVAKCRGCERLSISGALIAGDSERPDQLLCPRCGTVISSECFFDFVDARVVSDE